MREVAALAGVGIKTVSRVINGEPNVSPEMTRRVMAAATALDYRPDIYAGNLKRSIRKTQTIGLIVGSVANPFSGAVSRGVEDVALDHRSAMFASSLDDDPDREAIIVAEMLNRRVDALILTSTNRDQGYLDRDQERGTVLVFVDRMPAGITADVVITNNFESSFAAALHLIGHGHRRIAYLGDNSTLWTARERLRGFSAAVKSAGLELDPDLIKQDLHDEKTAARAAHALLERADPPTALFTAQNLVTIGTIRALRSLGLQHDVALMGFDDIPLADMLEPGITVIAQNPYEIGRAAAERAFARLADPTLPMETIVVPSQLVVRGSGEIRFPGQR